jgi:signal transduction histidine kinase
MPAEGLKRSDVDSLRHSVEEAISDALDNLRKLEASAQQRLHGANVEQQQLDGFIDEFHYRLQFLSKRLDTGELPTTITGPLTEDQLDSMHRQEESLQERKVELRRSKEELEQVSTRLSWLIHQIEGACAWVTETNNEVDGDRALKPDSGEQVMWAQIIMGQEAERARLAREIHDGPAQALANTVMRLQLVEQMFKAQPDQVQGELARLRGAVQDSLKDVRRFIFNLRPASLSDVGLVPTLRQHVRDYAEQYNVHAELNVPDNLNL